MSARLHPLVKLLEEFREAEPLGKQGRSFEHLTRWWLLADPEFKARYSRVERPPRDIGVDLCAFPHDGGKPTAVQCKQWVGDIPKREIDSFLSAAATDEFADSLLIYTGSGLAPNAATTISRQRTPCKVVNLRRLLQSDVVWPTSVDQLGTGASLGPREPREHQLQAMESIRHALRPGRRRTWVNMACGSGKTLVATLAADEFAADLAAVLVPTTVALHETVRAWRRDSRVDFDDLRVCSKQDSAEHGLQRLNDADVGATTSTDEIAAFLGGSGRRIVFSTYASAERLVEAVTKVPVTFDLVVADDAHNIPSQRTNAAAKAILDDDRLPARRRLFLTATPRVWEPAALRTALRRRAPLVDMSDSIRGDFGVRAYHLSHREAVSREIVIPFEVHIVQITTEEIDRIVASKRMVAAESHSRAVLASLAATQIAVVKASADLRLRRTVAFHPSVAESKTFAKSFAATAGLVGETSSAAPQARHVDVYDTTNRKDAISWFESFDGACLLSNVKLLAEGIDSPNIDSIIWNDSSAPAGRVVQAVGRALRAAPGKAKAIVIVPMVVGPDGNVERARKLSTFSATIQILDALRTIDPSFTLTRESLRFYAAKRNHDPSRPYQSPDDLIVAPLEVTNAFAAAIEHRPLPVVLRPSPSRNADRSPAPRRPERQAPTQTFPARVALPSRPTFESGLQILEAASGDRLLFEVDDREWLAMLRHRFADRKLTDDDLQCVASHLSFLADGLGEARSDLRAALGRHADRPVPDQLSAWLRRRRPRPIYVEQLASNVRNYGWPIESLIAETHHALTHPGIDPVSRARLSVRPLLAASECVGRSEDPTSRLSGIMAAIGHPWDDEPPRSQDGWRPDAATDAARAEWSTYEAGWQTGQRWQAQARLIARLTPTAYENEIVWAADRQARQRRHRRWDYTMWIVFIDELARTRDGKRKAARTASAMTYESRARRVQALISAGRAARSVA